MKLHLHLICLFVILAQSYGAELPPELKALQEQRKRKIAEIDVIYKKQLNSLKSKYTKAGDLDSANQVAAILRSFDALEVAGRWEWRNEGWLTLHPNGEATYTSWPGKGKWRMDKPGVLLLENHIGRVFEITIKDGIGLGEHPEGGRQITLIKVQN